MKLQIVFFLMFFSYFGYSQNSWGFEGKIHSGYLAVHRPTISHLPQGNILAGEFSYFVDVKDSNTWAKKYGIPRLGLTAFFSQSSNPEILGALFGMAAFGDLPFYQSVKHSFSARVGSGLAFATKVYDPISNPKNNAMSSHVNVVVQLSLLYRFHHKNAEYGLGFGMHHYSNGANKLPNLGLNYPTISLSYGSKRGANKVGKSQRYDGSWNAPWKIGINGIFSLKEDYPTGGKKYPVYALNAFTRKVWNPKLGVEFALDGIYKTSVFDYGSEYEKEPLDIVQLGVFVGHVLTFDRFSTILGMGGYFRDRYLPEDRMYHRIGMRYNFKNNVLLGVTLKSNWGKADYVEWSLGYVFNRKK